MRRAALALSLMTVMACGGGGSGGGTTSPTAPAPAPTPIPEGRIVLGEMVATYAPTGQACGDFEMSLPYTIQNGPIRLRAYDWRLHEANGNLEARTSGNFTEEGAPELEPQSREFHWSKFACLWDRGGYVVFKQRYTTHSNEVHDLSVRADVRYR